MQDPQNDRSTALEKEEEEVEKTLKTQEPLIIIGDRQVERAEKCLWRKKWDHHTVCQFTNVSSYLRIYQFGMKIKLHTCH